MLRPWPFDGLPANILELEPLEVLSPAAHAASTRPRATIPAFSNTCDVMGTSYLVSGIYLQQNTLGHFNASPLSACMSESPAHRSMKKPTTVKRTRQRSVKCQPTTTTPYRQSHSNTQSLLGMANATPTERKHCRNLKRSITHEVFKWLLASWSCRLCCNVYGRMR